MGQAVHEDGAAIIAALIAHRRASSGSTGRWPTAGPSPRPSSPSAPARRALRARVADHPGGRRLVTYDPDSGTLHAARRARARARRRGRARLYMLGVFQIVAPVLDEPRADRRGASAPARASAGTSTTTACSAAPSGSSGPATARNLVAEWIPALDGVEAQARGRRQGRRRRLRPRRLDDHHGPGVPERRVRRLRLPRRRRSSARAAARPRPAWPTASRSRSPPAKDFPATGYDLVRVLRLPARHGRPGRRARRHVRETLAPRRHLDDRRAVRRRPRRGQPQPGRALSSTAPRR